MNHTDQPPRDMAPWQSALVLSLLYMALAGAWILFSSRFVTSIAATVVEAGSIETAKGFAFVMVTGAGIFLVSWWGLRIRERLVDEILRWREATAASEKQAVASILAGSIAHDINNVLTVLSASVDGDDSDVQAGLTRLTRLSRNLQRLSEPVGNTSVHDVDFFAAVEEIVRFVYHHERMHHRRVEVCRHGESVGLIPMPHTLLDRALLNLLLNSGEATVPGGLIQVHVGVLKSSAFLRVEDDGPGFPEGEAQALLLPGRTTRDRGTGLGLLTVQALADRMGGEITIGRSEGLGGASVEVRWALPANEQGASQG